MIIKIEGFRKVYCKGIWFRFRGFRMFLRGWDLRDEWKLVGREIGRLEEVVCVMF